MKDLQVAMRDLLNKDNIAKKLCYLLLAVVVIMVISKDRCSCISYKRVWYSSHRVPKYIPAQASPFNDQRTHT